jgi:hypothetical protein
MDNNTQNDSMPHDTLNDAERATVQFTSAVNYTAADLDALAGQYVAVNADGILGSNADIDVLRAEIKEKHGLDPGQYSLR